MKTFIIYSGDIPIAISHKHWLADIYIEQRNSFVNYRIKKVKYKDSHLDTLQYRDDYLLYRKGYIITNLENEFVDHMISKYPKEFDLDKLKRIKHKKSKDIQRIKSLVSKVNNYIKFDLEKTLLIMVVSRQYHMQEYIDNWKTFKDTCTL